MKLQEQIAELTELNIALTTAVENERQQFKEIVISLRDTAKSLDAVVKDLTEKLAEVDSIDLTETLEKLQSNVDAVSMLAEDASVEP